MLHTSKYIQLNIQYISLNFTIETNNSVIHDQLSQTK